MNKPKYRFRQFSADWETEKLGHFAEKVSERNASGQVTEVFTNSASLGIISQRDYFSHDIAQKGKTKGYTLVENDDFVYNPRVSVTAPVGPISRNRLGRTGVMSPLYTVFRVDGIDRRFLEHYFKTTYWHRFMRFNGNSGARFDRFSISQKDFFLMPIPNPSEDEQNAIASFMEDLNGVINGMSEKISSLKSLKACCLINLFPTIESLEPKIRLKGFSGPWNRQKLEEYLTIRDDIAGINFTKEDVLSVSGDYGVVNQIEFQGRSFAGASISNYRVVNKGNVVYTKSPLKANPYGIIKTAKKEEGIVSPLYAVYDPKESCDPDFVQTYFESKERLNLYLRPLVNKGAKNTLLISDEAALQGDVVFPKKEEQQAITAFFTELDGLIRLHEEELDKFKSLKLSYLQGLYV